MSKQATESRLYESLERLLNNKPIHVSSKGRLTLNKINKEARLSNSYIHKFPEFVLFAKPKINEYNLIRDQSLSLGYTVNNKAPLDEVEQLKSELNRESKLKDKYRVERNNAIEAQRIIEEKYAILMFRVNELQEELYYASRKVISIEESDSN